MSNFENLQIRNLSYKEFIDVQDQICSFSPWEPWCLSWLEHYAEIFRDQLFIERLEVMPESPSMIEYIFRRKVEPQVKTYLMVTHCFYKRIFVPYSSEAEAKKIFERIQFDLEAKRLNRILHHFRY